MVLIPGGVFLRSYPQQKIEQHIEKEAQEEVIIPVLWIGKSPITQAQWKAVTSMARVTQDLNLDPSYQKGGNLPVKNISSNDAVEFCARVSRYRQQEYTFCLATYLSQNNLDCHFRLSEFRVVSFLPRTIVYADMHQLIKVQQSNARKEADQNVSVPPKKTVTSKSRYSSFSFEVVTVNSQGQIINRKQASASYETVDLGQSETMDIVLVPGGTFMMGSPQSEMDRHDYEGPQHWVTLEPFLMGRYPVTQAQWRAVASLPAINYELNPNPSHFKGEHHPVEQVAWLEAVEFCDRLSRHTGKAYRLPSEAEWEYACRAGTSTPFYFGETLTTNLANYNGNHTYGSRPKETYRKATTEVGSFPPNDFGLYDMHGNVWEWCLDYWHDSYKKAPNDGSAWVTEGNSSRRMRRGGSWSGYPRNCRCAYRGYDYYYPNYRNILNGFRVLSELSQTLG
jgi:formylglycine-generating enzyme required for sulfatase activity